MYTYELLLTNEHTTGDDWRRFFTVISSRAKGFSPITLDIALDGAVVRFFTHSKKDLSHISNGLEGFVLIPAQQDENAATPPAPSSPKFFVRVPKLGSILDAKEKYLVKKGINLVYARFKVRRVFNALMWRRILFFDAHGVTKHHAKSTFALEPHLLDIDFLANSSYVKKRITNYLDVEKTYSFFNTRQEGALVKIDTFPYTTREHFMHLSDFEFDKHSFIVGSSGSGKSRFIQLFIDRLYATGMNMNYRVIVIDPHDSLREDLQHMPDSRIINFSKEGASLFPEAEADITASTELTSTLLLSLMGESNARLERVLRFSCFVLFVAQAMSLSNLKRFVTDLDMRTQVLKHVGGYIPDNIEHFFGSEFNELRTQHYPVAIQPIVALVDEMELQPTLSAGNDMSIAAMVRENFLTVFSLNKVRMGEKVVKTVAGLLIQQIFLLAQSRSFGTKVILFVDEVSVVQNPTLSAILAEARKFGMSVVLTQQYFGQVETTLQQAILSNAVNYYAFKVSEEDARILEGNLSMEIPPEIVEREMRNGITESDIRVKMMTDLHPRECIVRIAAGGRVLPAFKARTMDIGGETSVARSETEELDAYARTELPQKFSLDTKEQTYAELDASPAPASVPTPISVPSPTPASAAMPEPAPTAVASAPKQPMQAPRQRSNMQAPRKQGAQPAPVNTMNLADVIAAQSSSRIPLDKEKLPTDDEPKAKPPLAPYKPTDE